jgi:hypothetical protein
MIDRTLCFGVSTGRCVDDIEPSDLGGIDGFTSRGFCEGEGKLPGGAG